MKFLHLADLHIGKVVNEISMLEDQRFILGQILDLAEEHEADALVIAGDVYDKAIPTEEAVRVLSDFLTEAARRGRKVLMISGNHDSEERLAFGSGLFEAGGVYIGGRYEGTLKKAVLNDEYGPVNFYLLPFVKASMVRYYHQDKEIKSYGEAVQTAIEAAGVNWEERNVIISHQFVLGRGNMPEMAGSEKFRPEDMGTVERVGSEVYDGFEYAALGHIHTPQEAGGPQVRYAGSPLAYSLSAKEIGQVKTVPLVTLGEKGAEVQIELLPLTPRRQIRHIKGPIACLLDEENVTDPDDYIYATLTDETPVPGAIDRLRAVYPNVMKMDYCNSHTRALQETDLGNLAGDRSFDELMTEFYGQIVGGSPNEEEWDILRAAAKEAGVIL